MTLSSRRSRRASRSRSLAPRPMPTSWSRTTSVWTLPSCRTHGRARSRASSRIARRARRSSRSRSTWQARASPRPTPAVHVARPRVIIPVFPGTNCEYDTAHAFERAGAVADVFVINNLTPEAVAESTHELARRIRESQIVMIPGGFSGGDEPEGSAKFITAFFRAPEVTEAVRDLLQARDGLMLGICNGFQALVKLGLVPYGDIREMDDTCPTLTFNTIGRHPEPSGAHARGVQPEPVALQVLGWRRPQHRDLARRGPLRGVRRAGQAARRRRPGGHTVRGRGWSAWHGPGRQPQWVGSGDRGHHLAGWARAGKMGHTERSGAGLYKNVPGNAYQPLIEGGVGYFTE